MFDGMAQSLDRETGRLSTVTFADFTYDVAALIAEGRARRYDVRELPTALLIRADEARAEEMGLPLARMLFEGHDRIARALFLDLSAADRRGLPDARPFLALRGVAADHAGRRAGGAAAGDLERVRGRRARRCGALVSRLCAARRRLLVTLTLMVWRGRGAVCSGSFRRRSRAGGGGMILHLYLARRFLRSLGIVIAVFVGILLPIDIAEQMRRMGGDYGLGAVVELSLLNLPRALYHVAAALRDAGHAGAVSGPCAHIRAGRRARRGTLGASARPSRRCWWPSGSGFWRC
jgi:hypothetical protein